MSTSDDFGPIPPVPQVPSYGAPGFPVQGKYDAETTARIYGMVANLDRNVGRLLAKLD